MEEFSITVNRAGFYPGMTLSGNLQSLLLVVILVDSHCLSVRR